MTACRGISGQAGARSSRSWTARRSSRCRPSPTSSPPGRNAGSGSTTTSRSRSTTTRCPMPVAREGLGARSPRARSNCSIAASGLRRMSRSSSNRKHTTVREHMPSSHRRYADWTPERLRRQAGEIGSQTPRRWSRSSCASARTPSKASAPVSASCGSPRPIGRERLEAACRRAIEIGARSYSSVHSILKNNLDRKTACPARGRAVDRARQHPRTRLLQLGDDTDAHPSHPRSAQSAQARRHGASLPRTRSAGGEPSNLAHPEWLALLLDREAANRNTKRFQSRLRAPGCVTARPPSRTSTSERRAGSTRRCSSSSRPAAGSPSAAACSSPDRAGW